MGITVEMAQTLNRDDSNRKVNINIRTDIM